jgi:hypothetical protein
MQQVVLLHEITETNNSFQPLISECILFLISDLLISDF